MAAGLVAAAASLAAPAGAGVDQVGPPGVQPRDGTATFTDLTGPGACSFLGEPADNLHVGLSSLEYGTATDCGGYLDVTGPSGTVRVKVTDHCRNCAPGLIDVTRTAFARIADVAAGRTPVTYRLVRNPPLAEAISLRVKSGSSRWWLQIQALDHGNPIARFEARQDGAWRSLVHTADNHWAAEGPGLGDGPFTVRITDVFGQQVTIDQVQLAPGIVQPTGARLYPAPATTDAESPEPAEAPPTATPGESEPGMLIPPLSFPPAEASATRSRSADGDDQPAAGPADADDRGDDGGDDPGDPGSPAGDGAAVWSLLLVLAAAAVLVVVRRRSRGRNAVTAQALRPTPQ